MSKANKRAARGVGDTEGIRAEDMGSPVRAVVGEHGKVTVRALASAYEKIGKGEEPPEDDDHHGGGAAAGGEVEADLNLEDEELQLDDDNLDLDEEPAAAPAADDDEELELDDEDLDLGEDEEAAVSATHNTGANQMMTAGDLGDDEELELDDEDLDLGDEEPAPAAEVTKPQPPQQQQQQAAAAPAASKPAAAPASQKPVVSGPTTIANDGTAIFTVQSHLLPNNKYLREPFRVVKVDEGALLGTSKKERIWDVDFFAKKFSNLDLAGYKSFSQPASNLFRVEKHMTDPRRLILYFFDAPHPYDLILTSPERRNRFFELAMVQRRNSILWCPSLCPEGINDAVVHVIGTSIQRPSGKVARVTGDGKFAVARMPYEIIDFWFGCLSLQQKPLPASNAILANFIPKADHDVYVIGVADIPGSLVGKPEIGSFFNTYLGSAYHLLSQTILESKDEPGKTCNGIIVLVRRSFILRTSNIDAVEIDNMKDGQKKGDFTVVAAQLRINESSLCCIMVNGSPTASPEPNVRSAGIRALLASINMGNETLDIGLRHDYIFVAGCYGFEENWGANDGLIKQQTAGNLLQEFKEATPDALLKAKSGADPFRVLYNVRAGTCRADIKRYYAGQGLHLNNAAVSVDLFTLRPFLSTFAEYAPNVVIKLSNLNIINQRMPNYTAGELLFSGEWLDAAPVSIHMQKDIDGYKIPDSVIPALRPVCNHHDFVRLQHMQFSIMGFLPNMKSAKGKPKKIIIASGSLPFKTGIEKGATKEFATPLIYRGCIVGSLVGSITYKESNEAV